MSGFIDSLWEELYKEIFSVSELEKEDDYSIPFDEITLEKFAKKLKDDINSRNIIKNYILLKKSLKKTPSDQIKNKPLKYELLENYIDNEEKLLNIFDNDKINAICDLVYSLDSLELMVLSEKLTDDAFNKKIPLRLTYTGTERYLNKGHYIFANAYSYKFKNFLGKYSIFFEDCDNLIIPKMKSKEEEYILKYIEHFLSLYLSLCNFDYDKLKVFLDEYADLFSKEEKKYLFVPFQESLCAIGTEFFEQELTQYIVIDIKKVKYIGNLMFWNYGDSIEHSFIFKEWADKYNYDILNHLPDNTCKSLSPLYKRIINKKKEFIDNELIKNAIEKDLIELNKILLSCTGIWVGNILKATEEKCAECGKLYPKWQFRSTKCYKCQRKNNDIAEKFSEIREKNFYSSWI